MHNRSPIIAACIALMLLTALTGSAATILDQPPAGVSGIFSDEGFDAFLLDPSRGYSQSIAENFQVVTGGAGFLLEEVVVWGAFDPYNASSFPLWNDVDVLLHADDNGLPGRVLCAEENVPATRTATGSQVSGSDEYMVTLTLNTPCGLSDGAYWVEVYYNTTIGYDDWFWEFGTLDPVFGLPNLAWARENPGIDWEALTNTGISTVAVKLNGTLGAVACVDSAAELQTALASRGANGVHDVIQVVQGSYLTPGAPFSYSTSQDFDLQLLGGFTAGCTDRLVAPANTVLDGNHLTPVLRLQADAASAGNLLVQGFTIRNGTASSEQTAGLVIGGSFTGRAVIDHNAILGNQAESGIAGVQAASDGIVELINNLVAGNSSLNGRGAGVLHCDGEIILMTNNTVADNSCPACVGGLELTGTVAPYVSNNILWDNSTPDLAFTSSATWLQTNDIGSSTGTPDAGSSGNLSVDPAFFGGGSYRLIIGSPVMNQGSVDVAGGLPSFDLDGRARIQYGQVDMGAYEIPLIFLGWFEDGTFSGWSAVVGGGGGPIR